MIKALKNAWSTIGRYIGTHGFQSGIALFEKLCFDFLQGCISRLRKNRNKLVEQLRGAVGDKESSPEAKGREFIDDLMREELKEIEKLDMTPNIFCDCCSFMVRLRVLLQTFSLLYVLNNIMKLVLAFPVASRFICFPVCMIIGMLAKQTVFDFLQN